MTRYTWADLHTRYPQPPAATLLGRTSRAFRYVPVDPTGAGITPAMHAALQAGTQLTPSHTFTLADLLEDFMRRVEQAAPAARPALLRGHWRASVVGLLQLKHRAERSVR